MYEIEKNVKMAGRASYPFLDMEVGDSFLVPMSATVPEDTLKNRVAVASANAGKRLAPKKFSYRVTAKGIRVWRVA